jgi:hypothetical protein
MKSSAIEVKVGQVWQDCDNRMPSRFLEVIRIQTETTWEGEIVPKYAHCSQVVLRMGNYETIGSKACRIAIRRMRPAANGFRLVYDPQGKL